MRQVRGCGRLSAAASRSIDGSMKAAVLPVPVWAMPSRSRPFSRVGIACAWIGVGVRIFLQRERLEDGLRQPEIFERHDNSLYCAAPAQPEWRAERGGFW